MVDGIAGTLIGGWIAQRWQRTNHRALYLFSSWSVALALPFGVLVFFGPHSWAIPSLFAAEFFIFLNTGPLNAAIVNSVDGAVRATAISINLFCIHFFGDTFSPQIIGSHQRPHRTLSIGLGATLRLAGDLVRDSFCGARFAPHAARKIRPTPLRSAPSKLGLGGRLTARMMHELWPSRRLTPTFPAASPGRAYS